MFVVHTGKYFSVVLPYCTTLQPILL